MGRVGRGIFAPGINHSVTTPSIVSSPNIMWISVTTQGLDDRIPIWGHPSLGQDRTHTMSGDEGTCSNGSITEDLPVPRAVCPGRSPAVLDPNSDTRMLTSDILINTWPWLLKVIGLLLLLVDQLGQEDPNRHKLEHQCHWKFSGSLVDQLDPGKTGNITLTKIHS